MLPRSLLTVAMLAAPAAASGQLAGVHVFGLPAGLKLVTLEDHARPEVVVDTWVLAGSREGCPGVARATATAIWRGGAHPLAAALKALGGKPGMAVDREAAHFWVTLPPARVEAALNLIGAGLAAPDWKGLELAGLRAGLARDAQPRGASPLSLAHRTALGLFGDAGLAAPVAGTPETDARLTLADLQDFYARHYLPGRTRVVLVGDFATRTAVGQVVRGDAALLKLTPPAGAGPSCPPASPTVLPMNVAVAAAQGPASSDAAGTAALAVLAQAMQSELLTRLPATDVRVFTHVARDRVTLNVVAVGAPAGTSEAAVRALAAELATKPVPLDVFARAVQAELAAYRAHDADGLPARAAALGFDAAVVGDARRAIAYPDLVGAVGREDLLDAARQYLTPDALKLAP